MNSIERHGINYRKFYYFHLRKSTFSICVLFLTVFNFGYSQSPLQIKETYDFLQKPEYNFALFKFINQIKLPEHIPQFNDDDGIDDPINIDDYDASLGDRFGNVWNSFLTMFKTTGDKAYLHHFISQTYFCQQFRNDLQNPTNHPGWWQINSAQPAQEYWDGNIIWPMAEYCFKMKNDPEFLAIANEPLPLATTLQITDLNKWPSLPIITYRDYADWLAGKVDETFQWYFDDGRFHYFNGFIHKGLVGEPPLQINQQSSFAAAMFYLGAYYNGINIPKSLEYLNNSKFLAEKYQGNMTVDVNEGSVSDPNCIPYTAPIFDLYDLATNATIWHTNGWERHSYPGQTECYDADFHVATGYWEDISHGALTLAFPIAVYDYQTTFWGVTMFSSTDMQRFANTVSQLLYFDESGNPNFYYSVNTGDINCYICPPGSHVSEENRKAALMWANLSFHDASPTYPWQSVYSVMSEYYSATLDGLNNNASDDITEGNHYLGLSYLTQQQWDKECVNLTLYNRDVVYDQDFTVKNTLTIAPKQVDDFHDLGDKSFAEPIITTDEFHIEPNVIVNMQAGESIVLKPGFTAKAGCKFNASIDPNICTDGRNMISQYSQTRTESDPYNTYGDKYKNDSVSYHSQINKSETEESFMTVFPNPATDKINIVFERVFPSQTIKIYASNGQCILSLPITELKNAIPTNNFNNGIYTIVSYTGKNTKMKKFIIQNGK